MLTYCFIGKLGMSSTVNNCYGTEFSDVVSHSYFFFPKSFHSIGSFTRIFHTFFIYFLSFYVIIQRWRDVLFTEYFHNNQKTLGILKYGYLQICVHILSFSHFVRLYKNCCSGTWTCTFSLVVFWKNKHFLGK